MNQRTEPTSSYHVERLDTNLLEPNDWNPNEMTNRAFAALVAELKHLGDVPKPIIVRPRDGRYQVIDGAHTLMAAQELKWTEVRCRVLDIDDFEAMRQCFTRNQHGTDNAVLLGRMFRQMLDQQEIPKRQLASELRISEGTVRNYLAYGEAANVRNHYAPETADQAIAELDVQTVRTYLSKPASERDAWLAARGSNSEPRATNLAGSSFAEIAREELFEHLAAKIAPVVAGQYHGDRSTALARVEQGLDAMDWSTIFLLGAVLPRVPLKLAANRWIESLEGEDDNMSQSGRPPG